MESIIDIKNFLPHRDPMLMVDVILTIDDEKVETIFELKTDSIFAEKGHFVEAGLIENAAQTCSSIVAKNYFIDENNQILPDRGVIGFISGIKSLKIHKLPEIGSTIRTVSTLISKFESDDYCLCTMSCSTFNNEALVLEGIINLFIQENHPKKEALIEN